MCSSDLNRLVFPCRQEYRLPDPFRARALRQNRSTEPRRVHRRVGRPKEAPSKQSCAQWQKAKGQSPTATKMRSLKCLREAGAWHDYAFFASRAQVTAFSLAFKLAALCSYLRSLGAPVRFCAPRPGGTKRFGIG